MATREETRRIRLAQWKQIFADRTRTGLTIKAYCELNSISRDSYFYWQNLARLEAIEQSKLSSPKLVELLPPAETSASEETENPAKDSSGKKDQPAVLSIVYHGADITVNADTPKDLLAMVLKVMSGVK